MPKGKTFLYGALSGIVEPVAALLSIAAASAVVSVLPYLIAFAARGHDVRRGGGIDPGDV